LARLISPKSKTPLSPIKVAVSDVEQAEVKAEWRFISLNLSLNLGLHGKYWEILAGLPIADAKLNIGAQNGTCRS
jgi:hypothetical protein